MFHCLIIKDLCCSLDQQLVYFIKLIRFCQELFNLFFWISFFKPITNSAILSDVKLFVKNFFHKKYHFVFGFQTEKEGFEPSRRLPDLHP